MKGCILASVMAATAALVLPVADARAESPYKTLRYNEDYRALVDPSKRVDVWDRLKYVPLGDDPEIYLSFGGELRERVEAVGAPNFGIRGRKSDAYLLHRLLLSADLHLGPSLRAFVQLGQELEAGKRKPLSATDTNRSDVAQAFVDLALPFAGDHDATLRVGRQEISLGSQRLVSVRESPNTRRSFDAVSLLGQVASTKFTALLGRPVQLSQGVFDDSSNLQQALWGLYTTTPLPFAPAGTGVDLYYLGFENTRARFALASGHEVRHSFGTRLFGASDGWDWDWEAIGQFGRVATRSITAWSVATNTGYAFASLPWAPRIGVKANVASGSRSRLGGSVGSFNALFPKLAYFNEASLFAPSNFYDVNPEITVTPLPDVSLSVGWDFLWRYSANDAVYVNPAAVLAGTPGRGGSSIGNQIAFDAAWQVDRHLLLSASYVRFNAGSAVKAAGGRDVDFGLMQASYKF